jgi:hypothetical protein
MRSYSRPAHDWPGTFFLKESHSIVFSSLVHAAGIDGNDSHAAWWLIARTDKVQGVQAADVRQHGERRKWLCSRQLWKKEKYEHFQWLQTFISAASYVRQLDVQKVLLFV